MKKKFILSLMFTFLFLCVLAFTVGAEEMTSYCDVKLTLLGGGSETGYFEVTNGTINGKTIYKTTDKAGATHSWASVVILDMRNCNYVGTAPTKISNLGKESALKVTATNVEQIYLPETLTEVSNLFLSKDWTSIKLVYIPKTVTTIGLNAFAYTPLNTVIFEEGSTLKSIGVGAFRNCPELSTFNFPNGVETIGNNAFTGSGIGGEVKLPNSVTSVGNSAFSNTKIESISFGNGPVSIGTDVVGSEGNEYLRKVYISTKTTFSTETSKIWYAANDIISFYVVSEGNEDTRPFIEKLCGTGRIIFATQEEFDNGVAPEGYGAIVYDNVSVCDAFGNGAHNQPGEADLIFTDAFTSFYEAKECVACGRYLPTGETFEPILSFVGYSTRENGTGFCAEYKIDRTSYAKMREFRDDLSFGLILSVVGEDTENIDIIDVDENGKVTAKDESKTVVREIPNSYAGFTLKLSGFDADNLDVNIVLCAYAYDGEKIGYVSDSYTETPVATTIGQIIG